MFLKFKRLTFSELKIKECIFNIIKANDISEAEKIKKNKENDNKLMSLLI